MRRSLRAAESSLNLFQDGGLASYRGSVTIFQQEIIDAEAKETPTGAGYSIIPAREPLQKPAAVIVV
jgi:hypothetical protein